jgi:hypothetical protein
MDKKIKALLKKLQVGQTINVLSAKLPRVVEMFPPKGKEGDKDFVAGYEGEVYVVELKKPLKAEIVALEAGIGKIVGIKLPTPPKDTRWYDAHECDGATDQGYGWWITPEVVAQDNPELLEK